MLAYACDPIAWEVEGKKRVVLKYSSLFPTAENPGLLAACMGCVLFTLSHSLPNPSHSPFTFMVTWPRSVNTLTSFGFYTASILNIKIHTNLEKRKEIQFSHQKKKKKNATNFVVTWFLGHCHKGTERRGARKKWSWVGWHVWLD